jgi:hypothetical protein
MALLFLMKPIIQPHKIAITAAVLLGVSGLIVAYASPIAFASPTAATNQTSNQTGATTAGGGDQATAKMHLGEAMKALQSGDTAGAEMHAQIAQDSL